MKDREQYNEYQKRYYQDHREYFKEYHARYRQTHKEQIKENSACYYQTHKEQLKAYTNAVCLECGEPFKDSGTLPSQKGFCSRACADLARKKQLALLIAAFPERIRKARAGLPKLKGTNNLLARERAEVVYNQTHKEQHKEYHARYYETHKEQIKEENAKCPHRATAVKAVQTIPNKSTRSTPKH
jgi:hypothetical protein